MCITGCASGWNRFNDDGIESMTSCMRLYTSATNWDTARTNCQLAASGGHLATIRGSSKAAGGLSAQLNSWYGSSIMYYMGCSHSGSVASTGWTWVDTTPTANINCVGK